MTYTITGHVRGGDKREAFIHRNLTSDQWSIVDSAVLWIERDHCIFTYSLHFYDVQIQKEVTEGESFDD